ncbi:recombinase RecT [Streptomyces sp. ME03-5709C]|nr:recombinase RecT [Streptomyces sp. ME03-5709C]
MTPSTLLGRVKAAAAHVPAGRPPTPGDMRDWGVSAAGHPDPPATQQAAGDLLATLRRYDEQFTEALPAHVDRAAFFAAVRAVLPTVAHCQPGSILQALLLCARFGLIPDGQQAAITADGPVAVFIPMYRGFVELMYRSGLVRSVHVGLIYERDEWTYEPSAPSPQDFTHRPRVELPKAERGEPIVAYAFAWLANGARSQVIVLSREDAEEIRDEYSKAYRRAEESGTRNSFWHTDFLRMWEKSGLRRLTRVVPTSAELRALIAVDDAGEAGTPQAVHAPDPEAAALLEQAEAAARAAEAPQVPAAAVKTPAESRPLLRKRNLARKGRARAARRGGRS